MSICTEWDAQDQSILVTIYRDAWTWQQYEAHESQVVLPLLTGVHRPVARILDLRHSHWLQPTMFKDQIKRNVEELNHFNICAMIFVVNDKSTGVLLEITFKQFGSHGREYQATSSLDKAYDSVAELLMMQGACASA